MQRGPSIAESARQRSLRVPLDYANKMDSLARRKWLLCAAAVGLAGLYFAWLLVGGKQAQRQLLPGQLVHAHAPWSDDCQVCHDSFRPLRSDAFHLASLLASAPSHDSLNQKCSHCHQVADHHATAHDQDVPSCAACHVEHRGPDATLVRTSDTQCLSCHRDLKAHQPPPPHHPTPLANVQGFGAKGGGDHPDFRSLKEDPGTIKFNHWLHLQPGVAAANSKRQLQLSDLPHSAQQRYATNDSALIQLRCDDCHQPAADGRLMRPIAYQDHCRACHPLDTLAADNQPAEIPHGLPPTELQAVLDGLLLKHQQQQSPAPAPSPDETDALPLIPGKTLGKNLAQKIHRDLLGQRATFTAAVAAKCQQCHEDQARPQDDDVLLPALAPAKIPDPWLQHARFDHRAHRHVDCRHCHAAAYEYQQRDRPQFISATSTADSQSLPARDNERVMIAGQETCAACHAPKRGDQGGARHDCAQCHAYHGGDARLPHARLSTTSPLSQREEFTALHAPEPFTLNIRLASQNTTPPLLGAASCASANCHGRVAPSAPPWQSAFSKWLTSDPHAQAYNVLFTLRSREMTRRLADHPEPLTESQHLQSLENHCTACHATVVHAGQTSSLGVECESCHGPADHWLHSHDRTTFARQTPGFRDTKNLATRASVCLDCHSSDHPQNDAHPHVVNHDLIAAGHPRLTFDLRTYLESLPSHWNRQADEARHAPHFHLQTWLTGLQQISALQASATTEKPADFAQLDCFACHHQLQAAGRRAPSSEVALTPPRWPPENLLNFSAKQPTADPAAFVSQFVASAKGLQRWDAALQALAAAKAYQADLQDDRDQTPLNQPIRRLQHYLSRECFPLHPGSSPPRAYDSPANFNPSDLAPHLDALIQSLQQIPNR